METSYEPGGPHDEYQATFEGQGTGIGDHDTDSERSDAHDVSPSLSPPPSPPRNFAPRGPAKVRQRFRDRIPSPLNLRVDISKIAKNMQLDEIQNAYTKTVTNTVDGNGTRKTLEQLQWIINSSQLLDRQPTINSFAPAPLPLELPKGDAGKDPYAKPWTTEGAVAAATLGLGVASLSRWFFVEGRLTITPKRFTVALAAVLLAAFTFRVYMRRQWLRYIHNQTIAQVELFIKKSNELDSIAGSAVSFITEVELIARGYRLSLPLPPVTRLENNGQSLKSIKIRRELVSQMVRVMQQYHATAGALEEFCNAELLGFHQRGKQCSPETVSAQLEAFKNAKAEDAQKTFELRKSYNTLQDLRRMFLLSLFCLEPTGAKDEYMKFTTALEGLRICNDRTQVAIVQIQKVLLSEELFNGAKSPSTPLSPDREKWRHQVRRIGNLNNNIRALQAKMVLLAEESNQAINNEHGDISHLGSMFMTQYELIGQDLKMLMEAWEAGKSSVALAIDRNERKRVSSASIMSPATSMSELASVSEESEGPDEALRRLTGEASPPTEPSSPTFPEEPVSFEAIAEPRPKSMMSREERIKKMHEDRESKIMAREKAMESGWLLGELKNVLQNREDNFKGKRKSLGAAATPSGMRTLSLSSALP